MKITNTLYTQPYLAYTDYKADYSMHQHEHIELLYVVKGNISCILKEKSISVHENQCLLLFPYTPHLMCELADTSVKILKLLFSIDFLDDFKKIFCQYTLNNIIFNFDELEEGSQTALKWLLKTTEQKAALHSLHLPYGWLTVVLGDFFYKRALERKKDVIDPVLLRHLFHYLETNIQQELTLSKVSIELGVSQYFLTHMITKLLHTTFHSLLHSVKIAHSKKLLISTSHKLLDIALECGYQNTKTFSRNFKDQTGLTPMQYRTNMRKNE